MKTEYHYLKRFMMLYLQNTTYCISDVKKIYLTVLVSIFIINNLWYYVDTLLHEKYLNTLNIFITLFYFFCNCTYIYFYAFSILTASWKCSKKRIYFPVSFYTILYVRKQKIRNHLSASFNTEVYTLYLLILILFYW